MKKTAILLLSIFLHMLLNYAFFSSTACSAERISNNLKGSADVAADTAAIQIPRTGQSASYADGDDFDMHAGLAWPAFRFQDNYDGTMTDILTGLMWPKSGFDSVYGTWAECLASLKGLSIGGYTDWRMPNFNELLSLTHPDTFRYCWLLSEGFRYIADDSYWSSTTEIGQSHTAWGASLVNSTVFPQNKRDIYPVLPVRSARQGIIQLPRTGQDTCFDDNGTNIPCAGTGQDGELQTGATWPDQRFQDNTDGTVTDKLTGLMWTKDTNPANPSGDFMSGKSWNDALAYVKTLKTAGYTDWRVPNLNELRSMIDYSQQAPALALGHPFINTSGYVYWSSTSAPGVNPGAWAIVLGSGANFVFSKDGANEFWPVRGGDLSGGSANTSIRLNKAFYVATAQASFATGYLTAIVQGYGIPADVSVAYQYLFFTSDGKFYCAWNPFTFSKLIEPNIFDGEFPPEAKPFCPMGAYTISENGEIKAKVSNYVLKIWEIKTEITGKIYNNSIYGVGSYMAYCYPFVQPLGLFLFVGAHVPGADFIKDQILTYCEEQ